VVSKVDVIRLLARAARFRVRSARFNLQDQTDPGYVAVWKVQM
jgi:hypothetical protein